MRLRSARNAAAGWPSWFIASLLLSSPSSVVAKKDKPVVTANPFDNSPQNLQYFEDTDVILFQDYQTNVVYRSSDAGESWKMVKNIPEGDAWDLWMHPYDNKRAYVLTRESTHWFTNDRGATWEEFFTDAEPSMSRKPLAFHAGDPDKIIFHGQDCTGIFCEELSLYTTSGFSEDARFLRSDTISCSWAKSSPMFTTGDEKLDKNRILCIVKGEYSPWRKDWRLLISDNYFNYDESTNEIGEFEPAMQDGRTVAGIVNIAEVKKYLVAAANAGGTDEMALYVSDDTITWHRGVFPHDHKLEEDAYTILESTNYSIQVDVMTTRPSNPLGVLFSSNSNGTYFTRNIEHTNRNMMGYVDFEKISNIQGIVMVNVVDNWEEVETKVFTTKNIYSQISFDDGRTFQDLKVGGDRLNLHSVSDVSNSGRIFSSPAPGLVMGVGNTGNYLKPYEDGDLYVSSDAGVTWRKGLSGPHKYEFGDQGSILLAIEEGETDEMKYSLNHGKDWKELDLPEDIRALQLTTTQDSTSLKFLLIAVKELDKNKQEFRTISIDFEGLHESQCKDSDMEKWYARVDDDGNPTCIMGHKQYYLRRKADADCFLKKEFQDPVPQSENCECTDADFECDYNFVRSDDRKECIRKGSLVVPDGVCKAFDKDTTFRGSSGWRLIPGNTCTRTKGAQKDDPVDRKCSDAVAGPASGAIEHVQKTFHGDSFVRKIYLERTETSTGDDETVIAWTNQRDLFLSHDHGKTWTQILEDVAVEAIYTNPYFNDVIYFLTSGTTVYYSTDRGENIRYFDTPTPPTEDEDLLVMHFHPKHKDWFIWTGAKDCGSFWSEGKDCHSIAELTTDRGDNWKTLVRYVKKCEFIHEAEKQDRDDQLIYCEAKAKENSLPETPLQLISSTNFFDEHEVKFDNIVDFATMAEFIVVATRDKDDSQYLKASASVDGQIFADAQFPPDFSVAHQSGYTVLDSSTHSVFLHVTVNNEDGFEYGSIIKSNSNGTSYVLSVSGINRDKPGYVDFEKMHGLEGVALVNVVSNINAKNKGAKILKTMITHNDGAEWDYIPAPEKNLDGKSYCSGSKDKCALHIHSYTERSDKSKMFSSASAVGLMLGVGNVGESLGPYKEGDTFITSDGGITWKPAKKGAYMWEFGDQGSIIVLVEEKATTNVVFYSRDEGATWNEYKFSDEQILIDDITTLPSDNSRNFLLWGHKDKELVAINIDFSGLTDRQCNLDEKTGDNEDYYLWTPKHPKQDDDCLFGHVSQYHRKKPEADCYNGHTIQHLHNIARNCSCTRQDFECDFNYQRTNDGSCSLVPGLSPKDHSEICRTDPDAIEYYDPTGYRRIPLTTCEGGREMEYTSTVHPCPGKEKEFEKKRGISGFGLFMAIVVPIAAAAGCGYWVYRNWEGKFGQIRLGEQSSFDGEAPYIKYPVVVISALVAVSQALPLLGKSLWRSATSALGRERRYTSRQSFARGRGDYAVVDEDEGELLGDESDEEV